MFNETLTYSDGSANHAYSTVITGDYRRVRQVPGTAFDKPENLTIQHTLDEKNSISRSLVKFSTVVEDAAGKKGEVIAHLVITVPREVAVLADVTKVFNQLHAFNGVAGNLEKLVNLES